MSLRLRLLLAVGAIAIVALVVADFATYSALRTSLYNQVDQQLAQRRPGVPIHVVTQTVACTSPHDAGQGVNPIAVNGNGPVGQGFEPSGGGAPNVFGIYYSAIVSTQGKVEGGLECPAYVGTSSYRPQLPDPITGFTTQPDGSQEVYFTTSSIAAGGPAFRVRAVRESGNTIDVLAQPLVDQENTLHTLFLTELAVTAAALVLAFAGGWWLVRLGLRPLEDVEATADSIAAGNLDQRVPGAKQSTEVGRLARALNVMLERIQVAFSARLASEARLRQNEQHLRQFVADASHELRTPIAAVSAYAELFERGGAEHTDDLPRIVAGIRTETARMDRLVNDLLTLARLDEGVPMELTQVELVSLVSEAVNTATAVGPEWPVRFWASRPVEVKADKDRLRQVIDNLLANVRAHTPAGTATTVRVEQVGDQAEIEVRDSGPGMPEEDAHRAFERFYRADPARSRASGGSGLGLSIVSAIVAAHGGTVTATSSPGEGLTVTVRLPLQPSAQQPFDGPLDETPSQPPGPPIDQPPTPPRAGPEPARPEPVPTEPAV
ncbi:MAG TPA: HAMP domain-containing sensor histidine kinase [Acidimicrobiales bacterium]|nr:HAMP domain-containing sensor histidine kinase [Acidimicrobiales bacterium]